MPRDASGNVTLPTNDSSPAAPRNVIRSSDFNELMGDISSMMTDSLSRSGDGAMLADLDMDGNDLLNPGNLPTNGRAINTGTGLTGGGDLSADRTIALNAASIASLALADTSLQPGQQLQLINASLTKAADLSFDISGGTGFLSDFDCKSAFVYRAQQTESLSVVESGAVRDGYTIQHIDKDTTNYFSIVGGPYRAISNGLRVQMNGAYTAGNFVAQTKDIVGIDVHSIGRVTGWNARGVSGIAAGAIQYGSGIASNEFAAQNPSTAYEQSVSMAAVQAIVRAQKGAADGSHEYRAILATSEGYAVTAGVGLYSVDMGGGLDGSFNIGLDLLNAKVNVAALRLRGTGSGARIIEYDSNDYTNFSAADNRYDWIVGGNFAISVNDVGIGVGISANSIRGRLDLPASTTNYAHIHMEPGAAKTTPVNGDLWVEAAAVKIRLGGVTKTFTLT